MLDAYYIHTATWHNVVRDKWGEITDPDETGTEISCRVKFKQVKTKDQSGNEIYSRATLRTGEDGINLWDNLTFEGQKYGIAEKMKQEDFLDISWTLVLV